MINKEKLISLPVKRANKDRKRRHTTHFTASKNKKNAKVRQLFRRKGYKVSFGGGKKLKTLVVSP